MTRPSDAQQGAGGVDVDAILTREIERAGGAEYIVGRQLIAARAAVAELVAAVEAYREADNEVATFGYGRDEFRLHAKAAAAERVDAALTAIGSKGERS